MDEAVRERVQACSTTTELTAVHAELRRAEGMNEGELWTLVQARWDEISAATRPEAKRARVHRPKRPSWAN